MDAQSSEGQGSFYGADTRGNRCDHETRDTAARAKFNYRSLCLMKLNALVVVTQNFCIGEDLNFLQKVNKNLFKRVIIKILLSVNCGLFNCSSTIYIVQLFVKYKPINMQEM